MNTISVLLLLILTISLTALDFYREDLDFVLSEKQFEISGIYYFHNDSNKEIKKVLFYPFPIDSLYGKITDFFAIDLRDSTDVSSSISPNGAYFKINLKPNEKVRYLLSYKHELLAHKAEYILTTTRAWGKPFKEVNYNLKFPRQIIIDSLSYLPDSLQTLENSYKLYYHKTDFMPDRNFIILMNPL